MKSNQFLAGSVVITTLTFASGCTSVAGGTSMHSGDRIIAESASLLGEVAEPTMLFPRFA